MQIVNRFCTKAPLGWCCCIPLLLATVVQPATAQGVLNWNDIRERFERLNPTLRAAQADIDESRAQEITAYLRPNPDLALTTDGTQITPFQGVWRPFAGTLYTSSVSYLHERRHKRELRLESARQATIIAQLTYADQERSLLFTLRNAFVQLLQAKAVLQNAKENLDYWDHELDLNRFKLNVGGLARVNLDRLELQRVQFESDFETASVNLRTSKIQLLQLLNDRTPIDQFDVTGPFDFNPDELKPLAEFRNFALATRPDLKTADEDIEQAKTTYALAVANGSTDPTFSVWWTHNGSFNNPNAFNTLGASVNIPLRIFDRNQGEKLRTKIDIGRNQRLRDATQASVFSDVDSAYWTLVQASNLLRPYKKKYLKLSSSVRDTMAFSFKTGGATLLDYLDAEKSYRDTQLAYINLVGSYLTASAQMNMAVGHEVLP